MQKKRSLCDYFKFLERSQLSLEMRVINLFTRRQFKCVDLLTRALIIHSYTFANCYLGYFRVKYRNYFVGQVQSPSFWNEKILMKTTKFMSFLYESDSFR